MKLHLPLGLLAALVACLGCGNAWATDYTAVSVTDDSHGDNRGIWASNTVKLYETVADDNVTINLNNVYMFMVSDQTIAANIKIDNLVMNDGSSNKNYTFSGTITGAGTFSMTKTSIDNQHYTFTGDVSGYIGAIDFMPGTEKKHTFTFTNNSNGARNINASSIEVHNLNINGSSAYTVNSALTTENLTIGTETSFTKSVTANRVFTIAADKTVTFANEDTATLNLAGATFTNNGTLNLGNATTLQLAEADGYDSGDYAVGTLSFGDRSINEVLVGLSARQSATYNAGVITVSGNPWDMVWAGTTEGTTWNAENAWTHDGAAASFAAADNAIFDDTASCKVVTIDHDVHASNITINADYEFAVTANASLSGKVTMADGVVLTKTGTGTLTLNDTESVFETVRVEEGTLSVGNITIDTLAAAGGTINLNHSSVHITNLNVESQVWITGTGNYGNIANTHIYDGGTLHIEGAQRQFPSPNITIDGGGTLIADNGNGNGHIGSSSGTITINATADKAAVFKGAYYGSIDVDGNITGKGTLQLSTNNGHSNAVYLKGSISDGSGEGDQLALKVVDGDYRIQAANTHTGGTTVTGGKLTVGTTEGLGAGGLGAGPVVVSGGTLTVQVANANITGTTINGGTVKVSAGNGLGSADVIVNGGTLTATQGSGTAFATGNVYVNGGGTLTVTVNDALGYGGNQVDNIYLKGNETGVATFHLGDNSGAAGDDGYQDRQTLVTNLYLQGKATVEGTGSLNPYGGTIYVTNTENTIAADVTLRNELTLDVDGELSISGRFSRYGNIDAGNSGKLIKTGKGTLTIAAAATTVVEGRTYGIDKGFTVQKGAVINQRALSVENLVLEAGTSFTSTEGASLALTGTTQVKEGATLTLTGDGCTSVSTQLQGGNLVIKNGRFSSDSSGNNRGTITLVSTDSANPSTNTITADDTALMSSVSGTGNLTLNGGDNAAHVYGDMDFTGNLTMSSGEVNLGNEWKGGITVSNSGDVTVNGATVKLYNNGENSTKLTNGGDVIIAGGTLTAQSNSQIANTGDVLVRGGSLVVQGGAKVGSTVRAQVAVTRSGDSYSDVAVIAGKDGGDPGLSGVTVTNTGISSGSVSNADVNVTGAYTMDGVTLTGTTVSVTDAGALTLNNVTMGNGSTLVLNGVGQNAVSATGTLTFQEGSALDLTNISLATPTEPITFLTNTSGLTTEMITTATGTTATVDSDGNVILSGGTLPVLNEALIESVVGYDPTTYTLTFQTNVKGALLEGDVAINYAAELWNGTNVVKDAIIAATGSTDHFYHADGLLVQLKDANDNILDLSGVTSLTINGYAGIGNGATYIADAKAFGNYYGPNIPEPTTTTLSLLALAALAARRRRK